MPRGSSPKRERQYEHIKESALERGESTDRAEEIAAVLPDGGHVKLLRIDHEGVVALGATGIEDDIESVD